MAELFDYRTESITAFLGGRSIKLPRFQRRSAWNEEKRFHLALSLIKRCLYLTDRRVDVIISGGTSIYSAEGEGVLASHPDVANGVVIGLSDDLWGKRVHAIIQSADPASFLSVEDLDRLCRQYLASFKAPKSYEVFRALSRDETGKVRRSALVPQREISRGSNQ